MINTAALRHRGFERSGTSRYRLFLAPCGCWPGSHLFSEVMEGPCPELPHTFLLISVYLFIYLLILKKFINMFIDLERGRKGEREKH